MPQTRKRNSSPVPEVTWDTGLKEMNETWKGAIACLGVAVFFVMTIGIIYWQVVDQPNKNWILKGSISGLIWERKTQTLVLQTLNEEKTFAEIDVGNVGKTDAEIPFIRNLCWFNKTEFCYTLDSLAEVKISLELADSDTECYYVSWTPLRCYVGIKNCFSMANISWYGGATVQAPTWPINNANISLQPFVVSDLKDNPSGLGSVLERYFLGSSGVSVIVAPEVPLLVGLEHRKKYCLQTPPSMENLPLQYTICVGPNLKTVHQESMQQLFMTSRETPDLSILQLPIWKLLGNVDSGAKLEKELRTFAIHLQRHTLEKSVISLDGRSTDLLANTNQKHRNGKKHGKKPNRDLSFVKRLNISITLSPYVSVSSMEFQTSIQDGIEDFWLSLPLGPQGHLVPLLTRWKGKYSVKLNITKPEATRWFLDKVKSLHEHLDMEYIILEGGEGNTFEKQTLHTPIRLDSEDYVRLFAELAERIGDNAILTSGARSNHKPLFICMNGLYSDWSYSGLKGIIPSLLHYSLLGYNFFLSDAVGGSRPADMMVDEELFVRWLEIAAFFPVISFQTPPWVFDKEWILNLTRFYIEKHNELVVPLIRKYAAEWENDGSPIYRPLWWISPEDPLTFTIDDQFLIGDEVLVSPVTEKGATRRDIYLPGSFCQWQDMSNDQVFDGGTFLENYPVGLGDVPLFRRRRQPGGR